MTARPVGFGFCGDTAPSGAYVCNLGSDHVGDHSFRRAGVAVSSWPLTIRGIGGERLDTRTFDQQPPSGLAADLEGWWEGKAREEIERTVPKAVEYGATDLVDIGRDLARTAGRTVSDEEAAELGIYFYIRGKLSRWTDAVIRGDRVSDDTMFDLGVYVRMAQRVRSHGGWPGTKEAAK